MRYFLIHDIKYYDYYHHPYDEAKLLYITTSLEDAEKHLMEFKERYTGEKGSCPIREVDDYNNLIRTRYYDKGKLEKDEEPYKGDW